MPWFGQGGKKNKLPATTELQNQKSKQIESLRKGNLNVVESVRDEEYRVTFQVVGTSVSLIIMLPPQFPQDKPMVTVTPPVRHPWVDPQMKVTGCPNINNFSVHSSLYTAVQAIVEEFMSRPPACVSHTPYPPQSPESRYPSMFPTTTNIFNIYPSMPAITAQSNISEPSVTSSQTQEPVSSPNVHIPDFTQIEVQKLFPELKNKSHSELLELLNEEDKILELIQNMPQVQKVVEDRENISCRCTDLAKENLKQKPVIEELRQTVKDKICEFEALRTEFERHQEKQLSLMDQFHPTVIQNNLKVAILEAEEDSDKVVEDFLNKKLDIDEFQQQFHEKRTLYHTRRTKEEKINHMTIKQGF